MKKLSREQRVFLLKCKSIIKGRRTIINGFNLHPILLRILENGYYDERGKSCHVNHRDTDMTKIDSIIEWFRANRTTWEYIQ